MFLKRDFLIPLAVVVLACIGLSLLLTQNENSNLEAYDTDAEKYTWDIEEFATGLEVPWDMSFDADGRLFVTERPGRVKIIEPGGNTITIANLDQVAAVGESGLTGLALHPDFPENKYIYLYYTTRKSGEIINRVSRFTLSDNTLAEEKIILDDLPGGSIHNGGRLRFGPDNKLWILTGDGARPSFAQDKNSLGGKVLRLNEDGSIPEDNPTSGSPVYSMGHRNPQGLAWHPLTEELVVTEHGETAHDEINVIKPNSNYGWPEIKKCNSTNSKYTNPLVCSGQETFAPSGIAFLGTNLWRFRYSFVYAGLRGNRLERIGLVDGKVAEREVIIKGDYGRLRAVATDKDGNIYVGTSNKDGRGQVKEGDDKILKITPKLVK